jgi:hypothetical protein
MLDSRGRGAVGGGKKAVGSGEWSWRLGLVAKNSCDRRGTDGRRRLRFARCATGLEISEPSLHRAVRNSFEGFLVEIDSQNQAAGR